MQKTIPVEVSEPETDPNKTVMNMEGTKLINCLQLDGPVIIPEGVTEIDAKAFRGKGITEVQFPKSLKVIPDASFSGCTSLKAIILNDGIEKIGKRAFYHCSALEELSIPGSVVTIGAEAFEGCILLKKLQLSDGLKRLNQKAFSGCNDLEEVYLPDSLETLGAHAFDHCKNMVKVRFPEKLSEIPYMAFAYCSNLVTVEFPSSAETIESDAFSGCCKLEAVKLPGDLKSLAMDSFYGCSMLSKLSLPDSISTLKGFTFGGSAFQEVELPDSLKELPVGCFANCKQLRSVKLPGQLSEIPQKCFADCSSLEEVFIPQSVTCINDKAFENCSSLRNVAFSPNIKKIGSFAFSNCERLTELYLPEALEEISIVSFYKSDNIKTIYAPNTLDFSKGSLWNFLNIKDITIICDPLSSAAMAAKARGVKTAAPSGSETKAPKMPTQEDVYIKAASISDRNLLHMSRTEQRAYEAMFPDELMKEFYYEIDQKKREEKRERRIQAAKEIWQLNDPGRVSAYLFFMLRNDLALGLINCLDDDFVNYYHDYFPGLNRNQLITLRRQAVPAINDRNICNNQYNLIIGDSFEHRYIMLMEGLFYRADNIAYDVLAWNTYSYTRIFFTQDEQIPVWTRLLEEVWDVLHDLQNHKSTNRSGYYEIVAAGISRKDPNLRVDTDEIEKKVDAAIKDCNTLSDDIIQTIIEECILNGESIMKTSERNTQQPDSDDPSLAQKVVLENRLVIYLPSDWTWSQDETIIGSLRSVCAIQGEPCDEYDLEVPYSAPRSLTISHTMLNISADVSVDDIENALVPHLLKGLSIFLEDPSSENIVIDTDDLKIRYYVGIPDSKYQIMIFGKCCAFSSQYNDLETDDPDIRREKLEKLLKTFRLPTEDEIEIVPFPDLVIPTYTKGKRAEIGCFSIAIPDDMFTGEDESSFFIGPEDSPTAIEDYTNSRMGVMIQDLGFTIDYNEGQSARELENNLIEQLKNILESADLYYDQPIICVKGDDKYAIVYSQFGSSDEPGEVFRTYKFILQYESTFYLGSLYFNCSGSDEKFVEVTEKWLSLIELQAQDRIQKNAGSKLGDLAGANGKIDSIKAAQLFSQDVVFNNDNEIEYDGIHHEMLGLQFNSPVVSKHPEILNNIKRIGNSIIDLANYVDKNENLMIPESLFDEELFEMTWDEPITGLTAFSFCAYHLITITELSKNRYLALLDRNFVMAIPDAFAFTAEFIQTLRAYNGLKDGFDMVCSIALVADSDLDVDEPVLGAKGNPPGDMITVRPGQSPYAGVCESLL